MPVRPKVLLIHLGLTTFVEDDRRLLAERYDVRPFCFDGKRATSAAGLAGLWASQLRWLRRELPGAALVYGWFVDHHMVLPTLLARRAGIPVALAMGGYEANTLPAVNHGVMISWRAPLARYVFRNASLLLPCTEALVRFENRFGAWPDVLHDGILNQMPDLTTPVTVIPFGFDPAAWPIGPAERAPSVLTVGLVDRERTYFRKGLDLFLAASERMPDVAFRAVGVVEAVVREAFGRPLPPNVTLERSVPREALGTAYAGSSVYAQFSRSEGLPNVLCEAMMCGCVPVGSAVAGIPDAIGDAGFVVETPELDELVGALRRALAAPPELRQRARDRIATHFSTALRRERLHAAAEGLAARHPQGATTPGRRA
ncbi:MAG TPA: glycosyltransferase family 4 protein [Rubricoccaceae bacterium]|nr:glycosyltransferase family 4 protein [Rubricoccaceae bacterium]